MMWLQQPVGVGAGAGLPAESQTQWGPPAGASQLGSWSELHKA